MRFKAGDTTKVCKECGESKSVAAFDKCRNYYQSECRLCGRLRKSWLSMHNRCYSESYVDYVRYGGRGITVCYEWFKFEAFRDWALTNGYLSTLSLDRKDNDGNYEPDNCRWITMNEQQRNKSNNLFYTIGEETKGIRQWCIDYDIKLATVVSRMRRGSSIEQALSYKAYERRANK